MTAAIPVSQSILIVSPYLVLTVTILTLLTDIVLHLFSPQIRLFLTTTAAQRHALQLHSTRITSLRIASNRLNSPATFAEYAKTQRALQKELKAQSMLQEEIARSTSTVRNAALTFLLSHGLKMVVGMFCWMICFGRTLFIVPVDGWMATLRYTPIRVSQKD